jgi:hypothetical protein
MMAFWWVNQGRTFANALQDGFLWAPNPTKPSKPDWTNMLRLQVGDIVFCYSKKKLRAVCTITAPPAAMFSPYPSDWKHDEPGTVALADYVELATPLSYAAVISGPNAVSLVGAFPKLQLADKPALAYLFELPHAAGTQLLALCNIVPPSANAPAIPAKNAKGTTRLYLRLARVGQGVFGKEVRKACADCCAATGLQGLGMILQAAHIKSWEKSSDAERLDPENGVLLHATLHHAFDQGLLSFDNAGSLLLKPGMDPLASRIGLTPETQLPLALLTPRRRKYLQCHRERFGFP